MSFQISRLASQVTQGRLVSAFKLALSTSAETEMVLAVKDGEKNHISHRTQWWNTISEWHHNLAHFEDSLYHPALTQGKSLNTGQVTDTAYCSLPIARR